MERDDILNLLLGSYKTSANVTVDTIQTYSMMLADIPTPALKVGIVKCIGSCKFFPTIAEIREASQTFVEEVNGTRLKDYAEAWDEVYYNMQHTGAYRVPKWSTEEIKKVVDIFGWVSLCKVEEDKIAMVRAQFRGYYQAVLERSKENNKNKQMYKALPEKEREQLQATDNFIKQLAEKKSIDYKGEK